MKVRDLGAIQEKGYDHGGGVGVVAYSEPYLNDTLIDLSGEGVTPT